MGLCLSPPCLAFENLDKGDLRSLAARDSSCHWSNFGRRMLGDVAEALAYLHALEVRILYAFTLRNLRDRVCCGCIFL